MMHELSGMQLSMRTAEELIVPAVRAIENGIFPVPPANQTKSRIYDGNAATLVANLTTSTEA